MGRLERPARARAGLVLQLLLIGVTLIGSVGHARAARHALVIGNSEYQHWHPLGSPQIDARLMATLLRRLRFDSVTVLTDANRAAMQEGIEAFLARLDPGAEDTAVVFYSGHGGSAFSTNYLLPVDLPEQGLDRYSPVDWARAAVDLEILLERTMGRAATSLFFLNNCLNNVHTVGNFNATRRLLDQIRQKKAPTRKLILENVKVHSALISYATAHGHSALSYAREENRPSPYLRHLVDNLLVPGVELREALRRVRAAVVNETHGFQVPTIDEGLNATVYLAGQRLPPLRLAIGGGVAALGLALIAGGAYFLAENGGCMYMKKTPIPGSDPGTACQSFYNYSARVPALLGVGLGVVVVGAALALVPQRSKRLQVTLAPVDPGMSARRTATF